MDTEKYIKCNVFKLPIKFVDNSSRQNDANVFNSVDNYTLHSEYSFVGL